MIRQRFFSIAIAFAVFAFFAVAVHAPLSAPRDGGLKYQQTGSRDQSDGIRLYSRSLYGNRDLSVNWALPSESKAVHNNGNSYAGSGEIPKRDAKISSKDMHRALNDVRKNAAEARSEMRLCKLNR